MRCASGSRIGPAVFDPERKSLRPASSRHLRWWAYAAVFVAALIGFIGRNDFSPVVHPDTAFEEALVQECLHLNACTTLGGSASFSGIYHMVGWLNFMTLAEWLGLGRDAVHLLIQCLNAASIVLLAMVADRLGGAPAAALTPYFAFETGAAPGALYDTSLMAFFGTVLVIQCVAAARERPPLGLVVLAALGAAVVAEVHLAGSLAFVSVLWIVALHPGGRFGRVVLATATFLAAVLVISPRGAAWDLLQLVPRLGAGTPGAAAAQQHAVSFGRDGGVSAVYFLVPWMIHRLCAPWIGRPPRGLEGALAVAVPIFGAYAAGVALGVFPAMSYHYLEHAWGARAIVLAVPLAAIVSAAWDRVAARTTLAASLPRALLWIVPLLMSLAAAVTQHGPERPQPRWADVQALARVLHDDWRWDWATVNLELRSPEKQRLVDDLAASVPGWESAGGLAARRPPEPVAIVAVETGRVPDPLPPGWISVSRRTFLTLLAIPTRSALGWNDQTACAEGAGGQKCFGPPADPHLLWKLGSQVPEIRRLVRRVPWRGADGTEELVVMPALPLSCTGRIVEGPPGTEIDPDGRRARIRAPGDVVFEWRPNTPDCALWDFFKQDEPPFVVAGDPETVERIGRLMTQERR